MSSDFEGTPFSCGLDAAVSVIGGKWKPQILWALHADSRRFSDLRRDLGLRVSEKVLTQQLRELERHGIVAREVFPEVPPRVEYSLTGLGQTLNESLLALGTWGETNRDHLVSTAEGEAPA